MTDDTLARLLQKVDEHFAHKEHVSSQVLMDLIKKMEVLQTDIGHIKEEIQEISVTIDKSIMSIRNEIELRHVAVDNELEKAKKNDDKVDKILNWLAITVATFLVGALLTLIVQH